MNTVLVTCYQNPDLDGFAGAVACAELLNRTSFNAVAGIFGEPHDEVRWIMERFGFPYPPEVKNPQEHDHIVLVDASDLNGIDARILPHHVREIIDHRRAHEAALFPNAVVHIEFVGAAATLISERFLDTPIIPSLSSAIPLSAAIISNTLNFKARVTTERDHAAFTWLQGYRALPDNFAHEMFLAKSDLRGDILQNRMRNEFALSEIAGMRFSIVQIEMVGAQRLAGERIQEILAELHRMKNERTLDYIVLSLVELEGDFNLFVTNDEATQVLLTEIFGIAWHEGIAVRPGLIMRKEIMPLIKKYYEWKSA